MSAIESTDRQGSERLTWIQTYRDTEVDYGSLPSDVPQGAFSLLVGVDGRYTSNLRTPPGYTLWMDLNSNATLRNEVFADQSQPLWGRGLLDIQPFAIARVGGSGYVFGVVIITQELTGGLYRSKARMAFKIDGTHTLTDPWCGDVATHNGFIVTDPIGFVQNIPAVCNSGRFVYVLGTKILTSIESRGIVAWWAGPTLTDYNKGVRTDLYGVPPQLALYASVDSTETSGGLALIGGYRYGGRLVDSLRLRASNPGWDPPSINGGIVKGWPSPSQANGSLFVAAEGHTRANLSWVTSVGVGDKSLWDRYQMMSTLGGVDADGMEIAGSGSFYIVDEMPTRTQFQTQTGSDTSVAGKADIFIDDQRKEDYSVTRQNWPTQEGDLATGQAFDFNLDYYYDWYEEGLCYSACVYKGCIVKAVNLISRGNEQDYTSVGLYRDKVSLIWTDTRRFALENTPLPFHYETEYPVPKITSLWATGFTSQNQARRDAIKRARIGMGIASDYLYVFGEGPIYRMFKDGATMSVNQLSQSLVLLSRASVCSAGYALFVAAESGIFMLDGASGTITQLTILDRLIRDRWKSDVMRETVQLAYDSVLDVVCILCAAAGEMVKIWLGSRKISMESCNYSYIRSISVPTNAGRTSSRVLFSTYGGKILYMNNVETTNLNQYTQHGMGLTDKSMVVKVLTANTGVYGGYSSTRLLIGNLTDISSSTWKPNNLLLTEITITVMTGPLQYRTYQTTAYLDPDNDGYIYLSGTLSAIDFVGALLQVSSTPMMVVGGPLAGRSQMRYLERKHVDFSLPILPTIKGDVSWQTETPLVLSGVCGETAITSAENIPDSGVGGTQPIWKQGPGVLSSWVNLQDPTVFIEGNPASGVYDADAYDRNMAALGVSSDAPASGTASLVPIPLVVIWQSALVVDLVETYWLGWVDPSMVASGTPGV